MHVCTCIPRSLPVHLYRGQILHGQVDIEADSVLPNTARIREVGENVAATVVLACQKARSTAGQLLIKGYRGSSSRVPFTVGMPLSRVPLLHRYRTLRFK